MHIPDPVQEASTDLTTIQVLLTCIALAFAVLVSAVAFTVVVARYIG